MYTIFKVLIRNSTKNRNSEKGFTLLELIFGLVVMVIVGGLSMKSLLEASASLNKDKKSIDSSQNLSAVLEIIGNDIRQSGEKINDPFFPTIEFKISTEPGSMLGSSKVVIRRSVTDPLTLCRAINAGTTIASILSTTPLPIVVADSTPATVTLSPNCDLGTQTSPLAAARPQTGLLLPPPTAPLATATSLPSGSLGLVLPIPLRLARDYRCQLADPNPAMPYNSPSQPADKEFCTGLTAPLPKVRIALSDGNGRILVFNQLDEKADSSNSSTYNNSPRKYGIEVNTTFANPADPAIASNDIDSNGQVDVTYNVGSPIYLIEERTYTLDNQGNFQLSVNGGVPTTLLSKIAHFRVSAKTYTDATNKTVNKTPAAAPSNFLSTDICPNVAATAPNVPPFADQPTTAAATADAPQYICKLNFNSTVAPTPINWKMIAGVKVELQSKYNAAGQASETSTNPGDIAQVAAAKQKLSAKAEFFPRNVLSR